MGTDNPQGPVGIGDKLTEPEPGWVLLPKKAVQKLRNERIQRQFSEYHPLRAGVLGDLTPGYPIYEVGDEFYVDLAPNGKRPLSYNETQLRIQEVVQFSGPGSYVWDHEEDVMLLWDGYQWVRVDRQVVLDMNIIPRSGKLGADEYKAVLAETEIRNNEAERVALRKQLADEQGV